MNNYSDKYVTCPFFLKSKPNRICCEGVEKKNNTINLVFEDPGKQKEYMQRYCDNIEKYRNCRICGMLEEKYGR